MTESGSRGAPRPLPTPFEWDQGFWDAAKQRRLVVQHCADCGRVRNFPRLMCPACRSLNFGWRDASGRGRIYSWSTLYRSFHPAFVEFPRTMIVVELDDFPDVHLLSALQLDRGMTEADLRIGMPVEAFFTDLSDDITLPEFRLAPDRNQGRT